MISIGLDNIKFDVNLGSAIRACACFGVNTLVYSGKRVRPGVASVGHSSRVQLFRPDDVMNIIPFNHVPVAIEYIDTSVSLIDYIHPKNAYYVFGAEDNTLGKRVLDRCRDIVYIPTGHCLNLAACINIVLYDRLLKKSNHHPPPPEYSGGGATINARRAS